MADFRVLLDLTNLHIANFKFIWINVSPVELSTIADFKTSVMNKINLDREDIKLFVRGGLLLENETIKVLREDDTVKVHYEEYFQSPSVNKLSKESKRHLRKRKHSEYNESLLNEEGSKVYTEISSKSSDNLDEAKKKKHKKSKSSVSLNEEVHFPENLHEKKHKKSNSSVSLGEEVHYPENLQKKKHKKSKSSVSLSEEVHFPENLQEKKHKKSKSSVSLNEEVYYPENLQKKNKSLKNKKTERNLDENYESFISLDYSDSAIVQCDKNAALISSNTKQDNVDLGKESPQKTNGIQRNQKNEIVLSDLFVCPENKKAESTNNCPKKKRKRYKKRKQINSPLVDIARDTDTKSISVVNDFNESAQGKHIIYSPVHCKNDSVASCSYENEVQNSVDSFAKNNISNINTQSYNNYPKVSTPYLDGGSKNQQFLMQMQDSIFNIEAPSHKRDCMNEVQGKLDARVTNLHNSEKIKLPSFVNYDELPDLNSFPKIGAHIAYRHLELNENYSPEVSEYREGIVKSIDPVTEEIEIELLQHMIKPGRTGKFENLINDEIPPPEVIKYDVLLWSSIITPKQIS